MVLVTTLISETLKLAIKYELLVHALSIYLPPFVDMQTRIHTETRTDTHEPTLISFSKPVFYSS